MPRSKARPPLLEEHLVLQNYVLGLLGVETFEDLAESLKGNPEYETLNAEGHTGFHDVLAAGISADARVNADMLREYDENIVRHTRTISRRRDQPIRWKYFQYLALLFTEVYLDLYFRNADQLLRDLNERVAAHNAQIEDDHHLPRYAPEDLRKLGYWMATGAGKTLIMHVNVLQYHHYLGLHDRRDQLNRVLLITPNPGLSQQHLDELKMSSFSRAETFHEQVQSTLPAAGETPIVEILHIQRLREKSGETTVAVEAFEGNNLVLVDEGHLGATGEEWMDKRDRLCAEGFSFEYSATFGQAMNKTEARKKGLHNKYAKAILFDYSYRFFYEDGYGKDYRILNLADDDDPEVRQLYLTACLLAFYQQLRLHGDKTEDLRPFNLEKPLCVFVGGSVHAIRIENKRQVSDVVDILLFLDSFLQQRKEAVPRIERLLGGSPGLLDTQGREVFTSAFPYLAKLDLSAGEIYDDILRVAFHAGASGRLHVEHLKGSEGELLLRVGSHDPFGLINVGDAARLRRFLEDRTDLPVAEEVFKASFFGRINDNDSTITVLIGSKKFTEGWNSWRVSTMGLMNIGRTKGPEVIQLFGRGVRLKGHEWNLKRSNAILGLDAPSNLSVLETLNVFGVRADYMDQFKQYLEAEGVPSEGDVEIVLPVIRNLGTVKLKTVRLKAGLKYGRDAPKPVLDTPHEGLKRNPVVLDWYPKLQATQSAGMAAAADAKLEETRLGPEQLAFIDWDAVYAEVHAYKAERGWHSLSIPRGVPRTLFENHDWYRLYVPEQELDFNSFHQVKRWQEIVTALAKAYVKRSYTLGKDEWERTNGLEIAELDPEDPNFIEEYRIQIEASKQDVISKLEKLKESIGAGELKDLKIGTLQVIRFDRHLYYPLLHANAAGITVSPVSLNEGERDFIVDLRRYYDDNKEFFEKRELYLLRNQSRRGIGFFEAANYYPDFILWLVCDDCQHIAFVDPHGLLHVHGEDDPKIRFHETIKDLEADFDDPELTLDAFIVSVTPYDSVKWWRGGLTRTEFADRHILFQPDDKDAYVAELLKRIADAEPHAG